MNRRVFSEFPDTVGAHPDAKIIIQQPAERRKKNAYVRSGKRAFDLVLATLLLIILSPFLFLISILVRISMSSPVLFRHERPGYKGVPFTLFKFRTMINEFDAQGIPLADKERVTDFGQFLRSTSLDELPGLFNVIKGEMSLVGPRPLLMQYLPRYSQEQMRRHDARPGMTGWAQVHGRNELTWEEKFALDVWYVDHCSLMLDIKIIILTAVTIITREGISQPGYVSSEEFKGSNQTV